MCMGCMGNAEFVVASGALGATSVRASLRMLLPATPAFLRRVSEEEAAAFVASLAPGAPPIAPRAPDRPARWRPAEPARPALAPAR